MRTVKSLIFIIALFGFLLLAVSCQNEQKITPPENIEDDNIEDELEDEEPNDDVGEDLSTIEIIEKWISDQFTNLEVNQDINFPNQHPDFESSITWQSFDEDLLTSNGVYTSPVVDKEIEIISIIRFEEEMKMIYIPLLIKGYGTVFDAIQIYVDQRIGSSISSNTSLPITHPDYDSTITWESSNPDLFSAEGNYFKPDNDTEFSLTYTVAYDGETNVYTKQMTAIGFTDIQKAYKVQLIYDELYSDIGTITGDIDLINTSDIYDPVISWESSNPGILTSSGKYRNSLYDEEVTLTVSIKVGEGVVRSTYTVNILATQSTDDWDEITTFLNSITKVDINTIDEYYLFGYEEGYERVPTQNRGYLPFYDNGEMEIIDEIVPMTNTYIRPGTNRTETKYIVIHNTGMAAPTATAKNISSSLQNSSRQASWHYTIDDKETYQQLGIEEIGWHAGDREGNNYGIGIESAVYEGVDFNIVMRRLAKLTATLLIDYNLGFDDVKQHFDFSGKNCPQVLREANRWDEFMDLVRIEYYGQKYLSDVVFVWKSLSPTIIDDYGTVINHPGNQINVSYQVTVTKNSETRVFTYDSILKNLS